jgi:hypothetical protein
MTRKPGDSETDSPGGHAADRLREFMEQRLPQNPEPDGAAQPEEGPPPGVGRDRGSPTDF